MKLFIALTTAVAIVATVTSASALTRPQLTSSSSVELVQAKKKDTPKAKTVKKVDVAPKPTASAYEQCVAKARRGFNHCRTR